jgi:Flp pilus assembly pilin Flp
MTLLLLQVPDQKSLSVDCDSLLQLKSKDFSKNEYGQGLVEYSLVVALIGVVMIMALLLFKDEILDLYSNIINAVESSS